MKGLKASGEVNVNTSGSTSHVYHNVYLFSNNIPYIPHLHNIFEVLYTESRCGYGHSHIPSGLPHDLLRHPMISLHTKPL